MDKFNLLSSGDIDSACISIKVDQVPAPVQTVESLLVDRSLERMFNVHTVARGLDVEQDEQSSIIARKNQELIALKAQHAKVTASANEYNAEMRSIVRRIYLCEERMMVNKQKISERELDIEKLIRDNALVIVRLDATHTESKRLDTLHELYRAKMTKHAGQVLDKEQSSMPVYEELRDQQELVSGLMSKMKETGVDEAEMTRILTGLQADMERETDVQSGVNEEIKSVSEQLQKEKEKQDGLRRDIEVLTKRNAAQMIRLKHQHQEVCRRNKHWRDEEARYNDSVTQMANIVN